MGRATVLPCFFPLLVAPGVLWFVAASLPSDLTRPPALCLCLNLPLVLRGHTSGDLGPILSPGWSHLGIPNSVTPAETLSPSEVPSPAAGGWALDAVCGGRSEHGASIRFCCVTGTVPGTVPGPRGLSSSQDSPRSPEPWPRQGARRSVGRLWSVCQVGHTWPAEQEGRGCRERSERPLPPTSSPGTHPRGCRRACGVPHQAARPSPLRQGRPGGEEPAHKPTGNLCALRVSRATHGRRGVPRARDRPAFAWTAPQKWWPPSAALGWVRGGRRGREKVALAGGGPLSVRASGLATR